jgi:CHAD domain-containing protein
VLPRLVRKPWRNLRRAVDDLGERSPDEELHRARILAKRARYAAEAVAPAVGSDATRFAKLVAELQTVLGEHQDSITMQGWLRASAGSRRRAFVAGELCAIESRRAEVSREQWPDAWREVDRRRVRGWIDR